MKYKCKVERVVTYCAEITVSVDGDEEQARDKAYELIWANVGIAWREEGRVDLWVVDAREIEEPAP